MNDKFLLQIPAGHMVKLHPNGRTDTHIAGAVARLDISGEGAVILFRSSGEAVLLNVDEFSKFSDFMQAYNFVSGYDKSKRKCKIIVWTKEAASSDHLGIEIKTWSAAHPNLSMTTGLPPCYFPVKRSTQGPLQLIRFLRENTSNEDLKTLKSSNMIEFEELPTTANTVVMHLYRDGGTVESMSRTTKEWLSRGTDLVKERYFTSKQQTNLFVGLEAYTGVDSYTRFNCARVYYHPNECQLAAYRVLSRFNDNALRLMQLDCDIYSAMDGWCTVDVDALSCAVRGLVFFSSFASLTSWVEIRKTLEKQSEFSAANIMHSMSHSAVARDRRAAPDLHALAQAFATFHPTISSQPIYAQFRQDVYAAVQEYVSVHPCCVEQNALLEKLINLTQQPFTTPNEMQDVIVEVLRQGIEELNTVLLPHLMPLYANHATVSHYHKNAGDHNYYVQRIKTACASAKVLCDGNKDIEAASKLYEEARHLCDLTEVGNSKRKKAVAACLESCRNHMMNSVMKAAADGRFGNMSSQFLHF